ncbi:hypothetical protein QBC36DRAFT_316027 [Triangularia setosa]|uniref:Uncharacterized protein n=1 Tax=Triangularia setosa TaxID=2587417 RepID=A0AAN7A236_9PEZI|nr:hypothetical protein QBC36DRAFT_316027 [Podospora setosa]
MERPARRPVRVPGTDKSHSADLGPTSNGPKHLTNVPTADRQQRLEAEETAERVRQDIERILQRGPLSEERMEELSITAKEFYRQSMERKRKQQLKELAICAGVCLALLGGWAWWRNRS